MIKLVRTQTPVLSNATQNTVATNVHGQAADSGEQHVYMGICKNMSEAPM